MQKQVIEMSFMSCSAGIYTFHLATSNVYFLGFIAYMLGVCL